MSMIFYEACVNNLLNDRQHLELEQDECPYSTVVYFSMKGAKRIRRTKEEFDGQFDEELKRAGGPGDPEAEAWIDGLIAEGDTGGLAYARLCQKFAIPPEFGFPGLKYDCLDPRLPSLSVHLDQAWEFAAEWGNLTKEALERIWQIENDQLIKYLPRYNLPWFSGDGLVYDSHGGALLAYLGNNPALTLVLFGV